jgi:Lung seven transmembrane receptor
VGVNPYHFDPMVYVKKEGLYSLMFANCKENKTKVEIIGAIFSESFITEKDIRASIPFYVALTLAYFVLMTWFGCLMYNNRATRVRLEEYIFAAIVLGLMETLLAAIDFANESKDMQWLTISLTFVGALKHGLARCILMMVSLGWGVTVPSLRLSTMVMILILGAAFAVLTFTCEMAQTEQAAGVEEENADDDVAGYPAPIRIAAGFLSIISFVIWIWVIFCLNVTIKYLEDNRQERKLRRYKWLLYIMIAAVIMDILALLSLSVAISKGENVNITLWPFTVETGFFLVVACVAILWRPNPNAREYAYAEELSMENNDNYELELTEDSNNVLQDDKELNTHHQIT